MENQFITITGQNHYLGMKPFKIGRTVKLVKEPENPYDNEAIRVELPYIETIGYVANSANTVFAGTYSAGRLLDKIDEFTYAQVMFITHSSVIAIVLDKEDVEKSISSDAIQVPDSATLSQQPKAKIGF